MSVRDMIKNSILESDMYSKTMSLAVFETIVVDMVIALIVGYIIYRIYKKFFAGVVYSKTFGVTLIGMTVLTCMVTLAISTNIVISLGMVGALSIVRYRTAVKEPLDILYIFWAITEGITIGASMYILAAVGMVMMLIVIICMSRMKEKSSAYIMVIHYTDDAAKSEVLRELGNYVYSVKNSIVKEGGSEMTIQIDLDSEDGIAEKIRSVAGVDDVALIKFNGEYHG